MKNLFSVCLRDIEGLVAGGNTGYSQEDIYGAGYGGFYLNLRKNKFNLYTDYSYYQGTDLNETTMFREYIDLATLQLLDFHMEQEAYRTYTYKSHNFRVSTDYNLSSHINLSAYINGNWVNRLSKERMISEFHSLTEYPDSSSVARNRLKVNQHNFIGGTSFAYLSSDKLKWDTSFDFQLFGNTDKQDQQSAFSLNKGRRMRECVATEHNTQERTTRPTVYGYRNAIYKRNRFFKRHPKPSQSNHHLHLSTVCPERV